MAFRPSIRLTAEVTMAPRGGTEATEVDARGVDHMKTAGFALDDLDRHAPPRAQ
jgi:hypothetical protein